MGRSSRLGRRLVGRTPRHTNRLFAASTPKALTTAARVRATACAHRSPLANLAEYANPPRTRAQSHAGRAQNIAHIAQPNRLCARRRPHTTRGSSVSGSTMARNSTSERYATPGTATVRHAKVTRWRSPTAVAFVSGVAFEDLEANLEVRASRGGVLVARASVDEELAAAPVCNSLGGFLAHRTGDAAPAVFRCDAEGFDLGYPGGLVVPHDAAAGVGPVGSDCYEIQFWVIQPGLPHRFVGGASKRTFGCRVDASSVGPGLGGWSPRGAVNLDPSVGLVGPDTAYDVPGREVAVVARRTEHADRGGARVRRRTQRGSARSPGGVAVVHVDVQSRDWAVEQPADQELGPVIVASTDLREELTVVVGAPTRPTERVIAVA
jgi:hypothetical protein